MVGVKEYYYAQNVDGVDLEKYIYGKHFMYTKKKIGARVRVTHFRV